MREKRSKGMKKKFGVVAIIAAVIGLVIAVICFIKNLSELKMYR